MCARTDRSACAHRFVTLSLSLSLFLSLFLSFSLSLFCQAGGAGGFGPPGNIPLVGSVNVARRITNSRSPQDLQTNTGRGLGGQTPPLPGRREKERKREREMLHNKLCCWSKHPKRAVSAIQKHLSHPPKAPITIGGPTGRGV